MKPVILVTEKEYGKGKAVFAAAEDVSVQPAARAEPELAAEVRRTGARTVIVGVDRYAGELYPAVANGLIARFGIGCDGIDRVLCRRYGIALANTPGVLDTSVAEHALWLMGAVARRIVQTDVALRRGEFAAEMGEELSGRRLLVVGFGPIGRTVARMAADGFGMIVRAVGRRPWDDLARALSRPPQEFLRECRLESYTQDLDSALGWAEVISVHLRAAAETRHIFNAGRFKRLAERTIFINTARGMLVDEAALAAGLRGGRPAGAGLDVFEREPYEPTSPEADLRTLPNVVLTPHIASNTRAANERMARASLANCRAFLAGQMERVTLVG